MGRPHRNNPDSRRISPLDDYTSDQPRALHPDHYLRGPSGYLHDPEKASPTRNPVPSGPHTSHTFSTYISEDEEDTKEHTMWILIYLSFVSPIVAMFVSVYTILTTLSLLLFLPIICIYRPCKPFRERSHDWLVAPIRFQLSLVFSVPEPAASDRLKQENANVESDRNFSMPIFVNVFSPIYAAAIAVTAWVAAGFWATAIILGNPDGRDGKDDGKAVVLGVRGLWERWLRRGLR
ncbi:MAG: hypothetical protein L6R39_005003 [Caloplaca ligustica]|nr:MAG: hypothetical protein L6R39_005003 [Caloplaca ligustica]